MDNQTIAPIIGGAALVIAALIGLLPSYIKRRQDRRKITPLLKQQ